MIRRHWMEAPFVALDVETANCDRSSICSIGLAWSVVDGQIDVEQHLVRCDQHFEFTHVHGITARDVRGAPSWAAVWRDIAARLDCVEFIAAHNAGFDASAVRAACAASSVAPPTLPFQCTVRLARKTWSIYPTRLPDVCRRLAIPLDHHNAASDAEAAARIVLAARAVWTEAGA